MNNNRKNIVQLEGYISVCSKEDFEKIYASALDILENVGMKVGSDVILDYARDFGVKIDREKKLAKFSPALIEKVINLIKNENSKNPVTQWTKQDSYKTSFGEVCVFLYDYDNKKKQRALLNDVIELIHIGDALDEVSSVTIPVMDSGCDPRIEAIKGCELLLIHSKKGTGCGIRNPDQTKYMVRFDEITGHGPDNPKYVQTGRCVISPLDFSSDACALFEQLIKYGYTKEFWIATAPISGATAPVTVAGAVTLMVAEILGSFTILKAINQNAEVKAKVVSSIMDMKTTKPSYAAPEAVQQDVAVCQFFRWLCNIRTGVAGGYTDVKIPGIQAGYEKIFRSMALSTTLGTPILPIGTLESGNTFSVTQAMIDIEFNKVLFKFFQGFELNDETIALDVIKEVGVGNSKTYLDTEHTVRNFRQALYMPEFWDRSPWKDDMTELKKEEQMITQANMKWKEALRKYEPPIVDKNVLGEFRGVIREAEKELLV